MTTHQPWYKIFYVQVLIAVVLGALVGWLFPDFATNDWVEFLGRGFVKLVKMAIAPLIFCTVVSGIAHIQEASSVGRVGLKALVYFEAVSTLALVVGLTVGSSGDPARAFRTSRSPPSRPRRPSAMRTRPGKFGRSTSSCTSFPTASSAPSSVAPTQALCKAGAPRIFQIGDILQVLFFAVLFGFALLNLGERAEGARSSWTISPMRCSPSSASS